MVTKGLFIETCDKHRRERLKPKWSLRIQDYELDGIKYQSAYQVYMGANSEYEAAMIITGGFYQYWESMLKTKWFMEGRKGRTAPHLGLNTWRHHKKLKDLNEQITNLKDKAAAGDTNAAKALVAIHKEIDKEQKEAAKSTLPSQASGNIADFLAKRKQRAN